MWCPEKIILDNLFAHKHSEYCFKNNQCTVIFGKNNTDRGMENNGAGKTTLLEGIAIALTNESLREVKKEAFINRESEECAVDFSLSNSVIKQTLRIIRKFYRGNKPVKIELYENGKQNTQITSVLEANKRVFELIGISREDLLRYFIISQDNRYTFFTASDGDKKEIMNRITSADMVNPVLEELSIQLKEKEALYNSLSRQIEELYTKKEIFEEQAEELVKQDNTEYEIKELNQKIELNAELENEGREFCKKYKQAIKVREEQIKAITIEDVSKLKRDRKEIKEKIEEIEDELRDNKTIMKEAQGLIDGIVICPKCGEEIVYENELELTASNARELIKEGEENIPALEKQLRIKTKLLNGLKDKIDNANRALEIVEGLEEEKNQYERKLRRKLEEIDDRVKAAETYRRKIKEIKERERDNKILKKLQLQIQECEEKITENSKGLKGLTEDLEMIRFWQFHMGRSGFTTYLANKSIKIIEGITNSYLRKFDVDLSVLINGFTVLKSGEVREKIDVFVQSDGITSEIFKAKSGGERGRVSLAGVLGIQHLINLSTNGRGLNLICLDECFNGIDARGQENIIKIMERMGVTILMITQNVSETFNNENKLFVVKDKNIARYVENLQS